MNNKISILIPTHKGRDKFVIEILEKLTLQSFKNFKVIITDNDYLKTEIPLVIETFDFEIDYIINKENLGLQKNLSKLISLVETDFFKFILSDDLIAEDFLEKSIKIFESNINIKAIFTKRVFINEFGEYLGDANFYNFNQNCLIEVKELFKISCSNLDWFPGELTNFIFRNNNFKIDKLFTLMYNEQESTIHSCDLILYLNLLEGSDNIYFLNEPLCMIRNHNGRLLFQYDIRVTARIDYFYFILECYLKKYISHELFKEKSFQILRESFIFVNSYKDLSVDSLSYIKLFIKEFSKIFIKENSDERLAISSLSFILNSNINKEIFQKFKHNKIIVYGAGEYSRQFFEANNFIEKVYCFMDDVSSNEFLGKKVKKLSKINNTYYFISSFLMQEKMYKKLLDQGVNKNVIFYL